MKTNYTFWKLVAARMPSCRRATFIVVAGLMLGASLPAPAQYTPPTAGLVAWWRGEGNGNDSADGHNGTLLNGVGFATGVWGQAFSFAGTANRVFVPDSPEFKLTNSLSIGAWVYIKADCWRILERSGGVSASGGTSRYSFGVNDAGSLLFGLSTGSVSDSLTAPVAYNQWKQVTATLDGSTGEMRIYIDGTLAAHKVTTVRPGAEIDPSQNPGIGIGNSPISGGFPFIGLIDELVLYSRALSPDEVTSLTTGVGFPPVITVQPQDALGYAGGSVTLTVAAQGTAPLSYLWYKDGAPLAWATNSSLVLSKLTTADEGNYAAVVSNPYGIVVSSNAYLTVSPVGLTLGLYAGLTITGAVGSTYGIQYATNLDQGATWTTITNLTLTQPVQIWCDTSVNVSSPGTPPRFYRVFKAGP